MKTVDFVLLALVALALARAAFVCFKSRKKGGCCGSCCNCRHKGCNRD